MQERKGRARSRRPAKRDPEPGDGLQGEGNRAADRRYREQASEFARSPRADEAAQEARRALDEGEVPSDDEAGPDSESFVDLDDYGDVEREQPSRTERERR
jgi:hypothetical protein